MPNTYWFSPGLPTWTNIWVHRDEVLLTGIDHASGIKVDHRLEDIEQMLREVTTMSTTERPYKHISSGDPVIRPFVENLGGAAFELVVKEMSWLWI